MLKTANKVAKKQFVNNQANRKITTHHVYENSTLRFKARKDILDTHASVRHHVGFLRLNREHRHNLLTPNYIKNIRRSLETLNLDQVVKVIYMTGGKGEHFSNGTDFRTLLHYKKEGSEAKIASYLEELYGLQVQTSKMNKPLIGVAPGHSYNSGAALLQSTGMPTVTLDSKLTFNEASFGFVPHGGSSYYLSRLPGEIGTFLALTGFPITGIDAKTFGISDQLVHYSSAFEEEVCDTLFAMEFPMPNGDLLSNKGRINPWLDTLQARKTSEEKALIDDQIEMARKKHDQIIHEEFVEPKDKIPSLTAEADLFYKRQIEKYNRRFTGEQEFGYLENRDEGLYQNYYNFIMGYMKSHIGHEFPRDPRTMLTKNAQAIHRLFYSSSLEEILDNLRREDTPFTKMCLEKMEQNSTLSMKLALKMIRQARNLDFKGCLKNEINVALNKIQDNEFEIGVSEILLKPSGQPVNPKLFSKNVTDDQVASYFQQNKWTEEVQLDLVEKSMLPTRFYYEKFSDQVRLWINEDSTPQPEVREHFEAELKEALREQGIDLRDRALTIESARQQLFNVEQLERQQAAFNERLTQMLKDDKLRDSYFNRASEHLAHLERSPNQEFYTLVNSKIQAIFEMAYLEKLNSVYTKSQEAHSLEKRRMFIKFKKFLFQSRILTYAHEETDRLFAQLSNMPLKEPHLKEKWDSPTSFREMEHPDINKSFLSYLSKAIGKSAIAPPEIAKAFLTSGDRANSLTSFTFDKGELEKLRDDILANPLKYELALRQNDKGQQIFGNKLQMKSKKYEEYDYWFRTLNEGVLPHDTLPYYKQLVAYKDFVDSIESKAFNTLKITVQRLINDFEASEQNSVAQFSQKDKESKNSALRRLMTTINNIEGGETSLKSTSQIVNTKQQYHLTQSARSTKDIKRFINRLVEQDQEIQQLIPNESSSLTNKFRQEVLGELYQLIEFVLINNAGQRAGSSLPPKHLLQERLASLTNPSNTQQKHVTNLRILDTFLNEQNSEQLIKDAIKLVKPFFFNNVLRERLDQEAARIFEAFKAEASTNDVLNFYIFNLWYPEARNSPITQRMQNFVEERDQEKYFEALFPHQSKAFAIKRHISMLGQSNTKGNTKQDLEAYTKEQYASLAHLEKQEHESEEVYQKQRVAQRKEYLAKPFDQLGDIDTDIDNHPALNIYNYDVNELEQIFDYSEKAEQLRDYLELNQQEIRRTYTQSDWLHMFGITVKEYGLDMDAVLRFCHYNRKQPEEYQNELHSIFSNSGLSQAQMSWENIADYALFLSQLGEQTYKASIQHGAKDNYDLITDYIVNQMNIVDGEELLRSQSVYEKIKHTKLALKNVGVKQQLLKDDIKDFTKLQQRLLSERKARENIEFLAESAPKDVRELVTQVLSSQSEYLNLSELEKILHSKEFNKLRSGEAFSQIIDRDRIFSDLRKNGNLKKFLDGYQHIRLDVVSLSEARETVLNAPTSTHFDEKLQQQMRSVLNFVEDQLKLVPHSRRESMKLGDFLARHPYISGGASNNASLEQFLSGILKNKLESVIGQQIDIDAADFIDWEYATVKTNPAIHAQEDARIQAAIKMGKGYNPEAVVDATIESQHYGRASESIGEASANVVHFINPETMSEELQDRTEYEYELVLRDARKLTEVRPEFSFTKNYFENEVMRLYSLPEFDQNQVESTIQRYTELRLKDCLLNDEFKQKVSQGNNGHLYLKMLKEQIADELKISKQAKASDFAFMKLFSDTNIPPSIDVEGRYNTKEISNLENVGLDKLINSPDTQTSTLDRLLGQYFLQKRGQYVATNELLDQLNRHFGDKSVKFDDGHQAKTKDKNQTNPDIFPVDQRPNLAFAHLLQVIKKETDPMILPQDFTSLMDLDIATQRALQNGKNGMVEELRLELPQETLQIPEHFSMFDVRKPATQYVEDKLGDLLDEIFQVRRKVEKTLTRNELLAYDRTLAGHLTKETLLARLQQAVSNDKNNLTQLKQSSEMVEENAKNEELQGLKHNNTQTEFNTELKNEDALYKFMAYSGMLEKKRREDIDKTRKNNEIIYGNENFEEFYKGELKKDSKTAPRPINPSDYHQKRVDNSKAAEGFKDSAQREADYFSEFELFKENKREQQERNQLFFVLEQFFSHAKQNPEPLNKAQEAIVDYFKDTENTFFFDKNKIQ